jgi:hypothetical protein
LKGPAGAAAPAAPTSPRWYPSRQQLDSPAALASAFKVLLDQHYALADAHQALLAKTSAAAGAPATPPGPPPGSGPVDTQLLGLHVAPVDVQTLADGATLKFNKASGNFEFS